MNVLQSLLYKNDIKRVFSSFDFSFIKNQSFLITGGLGLIGSTVVDLLLFASKAMDCNTQIFIADLNEENFKKRYGEVRNVHFVEYNAINDIDFGIKFDYIIHGAGLANPGLYASNPIETMLTNFNGIKNLLVYSRDNAVKCILYISSSEVYGQKNGPDSFTETDYGIISVDDIRSSYAIAKKASEMLCKSFVSESGVNCLSVRPGHVFGPTASPNDKRISSAFCFMGARGEKLILKSSGMQKRSYCYALDCASAILFLLNNGKRGESYNIGAKDVTTIKEMAEYVADFSDVELEIASPTFEEKAIFNKMENSSLNSDKLLALGFRFCFDCKEGIEHTVSILKEISE